MRELEERIIKRLREYRTSGDLLEIKQGNREEKIAQDKAKEAKSRLQGQNRPQA